MIRAARRGAVLAVVATLAVAACAVGCSALLDWSDFTGGTGAADGAATTEAAVDGAPGDAAVDAGDEAPPPPAHCGSGAQCVPPIPAGWTPVALFVGTSGTFPSCGAGFAATPKFDGYAQLDAGPATCSACACGAAVGVTCEGPEMTFYVDDTCNGALGSTLVVTSSCQTTPLGSFGVTVGPTVPDGGSCPASGGVAALPPASWGQVARGCAPAATVGPADCDGGQVCVASASPPFATSACILQPGAASACPTGYPEGPQVFYAGVQDQRGCSPCSCSAPAGGACSIGSPGVTACTPPGGNWDAPSGCGSITGPQPVKLGSTPTLLDAGACTASGGAPSGAATLTGPTSFCCTP